MTHPDGTPVPPLPDLRFTEVDARKLGLEGPRLSYMEAGTGQRMALLLHGIGANSTGWRFTLAALSREARVVAWNAPGYMLSDSFAADAPTPEMYADVAVALLDALEVAGPVLLLGSSFGSMLATCIAARHPHRVARLALLGTSRGQRWRGAEGRAQMLAMRAASIAEGGIALARTRGADLVAPGTPEDVLALVRNTVAATDARSYMQAAHCTDGVDVVADYAPAIRCPALCITGTADAVNPPEIGRAIAAAIPGARFVAPEGVGHLPELEAPARTLELLRGHLLGNDA
jgi:pimeloyl-ACP methyl ester carboxylesterase